MCVMCGQADRHNHSSARARVCVSEWMSGVWLCLSFLLYSRCNDVTKLTYAHTLDTLTHCHTHLHSLTHTHTHTHTPTLTHTARRATTRSPGTKTRTAWAPLPMRPSSPAASAPLAWPSSISTGTETPTSPLLIRVTRTTYTCWPTTVRVGLTPPPCLMARAPAPPPALPRAAVLSPPPMPFLLRMAALCFQVRLHTCSISR